VPINGKKSLYDYLEEKGVVIEAYDDTELEPFYICDNSELRTIEESCSVDKEGIHLVNYHKKNHGSNTKDKKDSKQPKKTAKSIKKLGCHFK